VIWVEPASDRFQWRTFYVRNVEHMDSMRTETVLFFVPYNTYKNRKNKCDTSLHKRTGSLDPLKLIYCTSKMELYTFRLLAAVIIHNNPAIFVYSIMSRKPYSFKLTICFFRFASRPALRPTQPPIQWE